MNAWCASSELIFRRSQDEIEQLAQRVFERGNLFRSVFFPDVKNFRPPDRTMAPTDARLGQRLSQGMGITEATKEDDAGAMMTAESNMMVDRDEDYNTRYAGYKGNLMAWERTKQIPRRTAAIDLGAMVRGANADTPEKVVDYFVRRFLSVPVSANDRGVLVKFLQDKVGARVPSGAAAEQPLRELLYLVLSTPEHQLG